MDGLGAELQQRVSKRLQRASRNLVGNKHFSTSFHYDGTSRQWTARARSYGTPFNAGSAQLAVAANAYDAETGEQVGNHAIGVINLMNAKR